MGLNRIGIIPLTGIGHRFQEAGYTTPKHLLSVNGRPMIQHVTDAMDCELNIIICRPEYVSGLRELYPKDNAWLLVPSIPTHSPIQAITAVDVELMVFADIPCLVNYCDCWLPNGVDCLVDKGMPSCAVFRDDAERHSRSAGGFAVGGVYYFPKTWDLLVDIARADYSENVMYDVMNNGKLYEVVVDNYVDLGVPSAYEEYTR